MRSSALRSEKTHLENVIERAKIRKTHLENARRRLAQEQRAEHDWKAFVERVGALVPSWDREVFVQRFRGSSEQERADTQEL